MITRRQLVRGGLATLGVGAAGGVLRAADQGVFGAGRGNAYALWETWDLGGGPEPVVAAAVLASNAHDSQPWRFRLDTSGLRRGGTAGQAVLEVLHDPRRHLGAVDPARREMHLSLGCAVENAHRVAVARGWNPVTTLLPDGGRSDVVARLQLDHGAPVADRLAAAVPRRHTNRHPYRDAGVGARALTALDAAVADIDGVHVRWLTGATDLTAFREGTVAATAALTADDQMSADSHAWQQHDRSRLQEEADGLTYDAGISDPVTRTAAKVLPDLGEDAANAGFVTATQMHVDTAPAVGIVVAGTAAGDEGLDGSAAARRTWLSAGRLWQRLHLAITDADLAAQPLNQLAELTDRERQLGAPPRFGEILADLAGPGLVPVMPFRLGHPTRAASPSPRRPLARVLHVE